MLLYRAIDMLRMKWYSEFHARRLNGQASMDPEAFSMRLATAERLLVQTERKDELVVC